MEEGIAIIAVFGFIPLIVWIVSVYRSRAHARATEVMMLMVERGEEITPTKVKALGIQPSAPHRDLKVGMILVAISLGLVILSNVVGVHDDEAQTALRGIASFPFLVGSVYIIFWFLFGRKQLDD